MLKHVLSAAVLAVSVAALAMAQSADPEAGSASRASVDRMAQSAAGTDTPGGIFLPRQDSNQVLANSLIGASVLGADGKEIGSVKDLILDTGGRTVGFLVGYGGVLGVGVKEVGVPFQGATIGTADKGSDRVVRLEITQDQFDRAPAFKDEGAQQAERDRMRDQGAPRPERRM